MCVQGSAEPIHAAAHPKPTYSGSLLRSPAVVLLDVLEKLLPAG